MWIGADRPGPALGEPRLDDSSISRTKRARVTAHASKRLYKFRGCPSGHKTGARHCVLAFAFSLAHEGLRCQLLSTTLFTPVWQLHTWACTWITWASSPTLAIAATTVLTPCVSEPISVIPFQFCEPIPTSSKLCCPPRPPLLRLHPAIFRNNPPKFCVRMCGKWD